MAQSLIGLGANLGTPSETLRIAIEHLASAADWQLLQASRIWITQPIGGPTGQPLFANAACLLETSLPPLELLDRLQAIEQRLGRTRSVAWGPRTIDLDLLTFDDLLLHTDRLTLPHPWLAARRFVLEPACELAPAWRHPALDWSLRDLTEQARSQRQRFWFAGRPIAPPQRALLAAAAGARWVPASSCPAEQDEPDGWQWHVRELRDAGWDDATEEILLSGSWQFAAPPDTRSESTRRALLPQDSPAAAWPLLPPKAVILCCDAASPPVTTTAALHLLQDTPGLATLVQDQRCPWISVAAPHASEAQLRWAAGVISGLSDQSLHPVDGPLYP